MKTITITIRQTRKRTSKFESNALTAKLNGRIKRGEILIYEICDGAYVFSACRSDNRRFAVYRNGDLVYPRFDRNKLPTKIDRVYAIGLKSKPVLVYSSEGRK